MPEPNPTVRRLVVRSLAQRPGRSLLLLLGYALGVGVTIALLSIGSALLVQARDRELVGGGQVTVLPLGLDLETFKTGGVTSLYFTIDQAPFLYRQVLRGPRFADRIEAAAPWLEDQLLYLQAGDTRVAVSADGQIPSLTRALGVEPDVREGEWADVAADRLWAQPSDSALYAALDAFHLPGAAAGDTTWAEWHYFNLRGLEEDGWLYLTFLIGGDLPDGRWGGELFATLVRPGSGSRQFAVSLAPEDVAFHLDRPDLRLGDSFVALAADGTYTVRARLPEFAGEPGEGGEVGEVSAGGGPAGRTPSRRPGGALDTLTIDVRIVPEPGVYLPPLEVSPGGFPSGYTVPVLAGAAEGEVCLRGGCETLAGAPAYHDHNWGVWRDVTWDWGEARLARHTLLYGGVRGPTGDPGSRFLFLTDSLGFLGLFSIDSIGYAWADDWPDRLAVWATRGDDAVVLEVAVDHARATPRATGDPAEGASIWEGDVFYQMEGPAALRGRLGGRDLEDTGRGFFETWRRADRVP